MDVSSEQDLGLFFKTVKAEICSHLINAYFDGKGRENLMFSEISPDSVKAFKPSVRAPFVSLIFTLIFGFCVYYFANDILKFAYMQTFEYSFWNAELVKTLQMGMKYLGLGLMVLGGLINGIIILKNWVVQYEITPTRLMYHHGILVRRHDQIELRRIRDFEVTQPIFSQSMGLGRVKLITRDETHPIFKMGPFVNAREIEEFVREGMEAHQRATGYRELEGY